MASVNVGAVSQSLKMCIHGLDGESKKTILVISTGLCTRQERSQRAPEKLLAHILVLF